MASGLKAKRQVWGVIFLLAAALACVSYYFVSRYLTAVYEIDQTLAVRSSIEGAVSLVTDAETNQRGFVLTGEEPYLDSYETARVGIPRRLVDLRRDSRDDPFQSSHLETLERLIEAKASFMENTIRLRREGDVSAVLALVRGGEGKRLMDAIRVECRLMGDRNQKLLDGHRREAATRRTVAAWAAGLGSLLTVLLALISFLTVNRDVEILTRAARSLAVEEEHFRSLTEHSSDLVRLLDLNGRTTYVSPSVERLLGFGVEEFMSLPPRSLMHPDELELAGSILAEVRSGSMKGGLSTYRLRNKAGEYRYFEVHWTTHNNEAGVVASLHTIGRDVTDRKHAEEVLHNQAEHLRTLSLRDDLTKLYNRRGFLEIAGKAQERAAREQRPSALVFVDLNGMKRINDELGHDAGDTALRDTAVVLTAALRATDVIARLGGDEFVAFSVDFTASDLATLRQKLRVLADSETARLKRGYRLSMSVGAAFSDVTAPQTLGDLLENADAAMYQQKRARQEAGNVSIIPPREHG